MDTVPPLEENEILLRRIPPTKPGHRTVETLDDGSERASSSSMKPRKVNGKVEIALSCSRLLLTSPRELLAQLESMEPPIDSTGWRVCYFLVSDVMSIQDGENGYLVVTPDPRHDPPMDFGHCGIYGANQSPCPKSKSAAKRLARVTRMLTQAEAEFMKRGSDLP